MLKIIVDWGISMEWDKERRYTYRDYLKWAEAGYMGMELIDGVPYQYGVSVFEQDPFPVSPESRRGICERLCYRFTQCLANTEYNAHQYRAIYERRNSSNRAYSSRFSTFSSPVFRCVRMVLTVHPA